MKIMPPPAVVTAVSILPDQVQFDCPVCDVTHMLTRGLDYGEDPDGSWRVQEPGGYACDCGVLIQADFQLSLTRPKAPT